MLPNKSNAHSKIQQVSSEELNNIKGGESSFYPQPGFIVTAIGDDVDITQGEGFISVNSSSSSNLNGSISSSSNSTRVVTSGNSFVEVNSSNSINL